MALPTPAGANQGGFLSSSVTAHAPFPPRLSPRLCQKRDPLSAPSYPVCCPGADLLSGLPKLLQLSQHIPVWSETHPTPVWKEALLSLGRQGLASFPAPSPGQASLNHGSKAGRAALSQEWYVKLGLVKKNGRESAEKSTIKSYFIITPHAKFGGGPTLPHLILKVLTAHLSFLQLFIQQTSLGWCILNLMFHIPCSLIPLYHGLHCAFPRNLAPFG